MAATVGEQTQRRAVAGELCTCGRAAVVVFEGGRFGPTGWCGRSDGGEFQGPCPFCAGRRHDGRCPRYALRGPAEVGVLLVCQGCRHEFEAQPHDHEIGQLVSDGCPRCGDWVFLVELAPSGGAVP